MMTRNFSRHEFACRCGCGLAEPHPALVVWLQDFRDIIRAPVVITSGSRCQVHNKAIGGAANSYHMPRTDYDGYTCAADILVMSHPLVTVVDMLETMGRFGGIAPYLLLDTAWVHVDVRGVNGLSVPPYREGWIDRQKADIEAVLEEEALRRKARGQA